MGETFGAWADNLPPDERAVLAAYKGEEYRPINLALRRGEELTDEQAAQVALLDRALQRFRLPEPVVVFRGFHLSSAVAVGAQIEDRAYFSTSLLREHAEGFLELPGDQPFRPALARVLLPAGMRCGAPDLIEYVGEAEILLPRSSEFAVRSVTRPRGTQARWVIDLEASV